MTGDQQSFQLLLATALLIIVGIGRQVSGSIDADGWLSAIPRFGWWLSVGFLCLFVSRQSGTGWTLAAAEWILVSSLLVLMCSRIIRPADQDDADD